MPWFDFFWNDAIIDHLAQHDVTPEEFEYVVCRPVRIGESDSSGRPMVRGYTHAGRWIVCVYELEDDGISGHSGDSLRAHRGLRGAIMLERRNREFTPELRERWLRAAAEEERARLANSRRALRDLAAVEEQTFSGELRRAMIASHIGIREIADQAQVPFETVNAFMGGEAVLDSDAISRIVRVLDCRLVGNG